MLAQTPISTVLKPHLKPFYLPAFPRGDDCCATTAWASIMVGLMCVFPIALLPTQVLTCLLCSFPLCIGSVPFVCLCWQCFQLSGCPLGIKAATGAWLQGRIIPCCAGELQSVSQRVGCEPRTRTCSPPCGKR